MEHNALLLDLRKELDVTRAVYREMQLTDMSGWTVEDKVLADIRSRKVSHKLTELILQYERELDKVCGT